ncbi:restriction endonuclease [Sphingobacterium thalpophilum]|uniref:restriction endonuclease n=1 Tax=Sphingobacterium thalpophilum TaxID=259 RepID=UPI003D951788
MAIDAKQIQATAEIATLIYDFLPANPHPYADPSISFPGCAAKVGLSNLWKGGSKKPAVSQLLRDTLDHSRGRFCTLIVEIVNTSIIYRTNKGNPIKRKEIEDLNNLITKVGFKIPELWDRSFLESLYSEAPVNEKPKESTDSALLIEKLRTEYIDLAGLEPHKRGYAFQDLLNKAFNAYGLSPKRPFRITGEEIDGSFEVNGHTYLLEAKWHGDKTGQKDLLVFSGKVGGKSTWSRGLFISYTGFSEDGLEAFARGKQANIIGMDGQDLFFILDGKMKLDEAINLKARRAAERNDFFASVYKLSI